MKKLLIPILILLMAGCSRIPVQDTIDKGCEYARYYCEEGQKKVAWTCSTAETICDIIETQEDSIITLNSSLARKPITQVKFIDKKVCVPTGEPFIIYFDLDKSELLSESYTVLDMVIAVAQECPNAKLKISGYTCDLGTEEYNIQLSERRVKATLNYLNEEGIRIGRTTVGFYGEKYPQFPGELEELRAKNRRVEIVIE